MSNFAIGPVIIEVPLGEHAAELVPPSEWRSDGLKRPARVTLANLKAEDGLRAQVSLVRWDDVDEVALGFTEVFMGPADYKRLEQAGTMSPKIAGDMFVARIRALRYGESDRATVSSVGWHQIDEWAGEDSRRKLIELGATRAGSYGELFPSATRFRAEPAVEVVCTQPDALFAVYVLTRVIPIMVGFGKQRLESPNE